MGIKDKLKGLSSFQEADNIVYYNGDFYWISDEELPEGFEGEEADIETDAIPAMRRSIGFGKPIEANYDTEATDNTFRSEFNGFFANDDGFFTDSTKRIYKSVKTKEKRDHFLKKGRKVYCIKNSCSDCDLSETCDVKLEEVTNWSGYKCLTLDCASQEPMILTWFTAEKALLELFRNRHLRVEGLLKYMDFIYGEHFSQDPNEIKAQVYWEWVDRNFHLNPIELVKFNSLIDRFKAGDDSIKNDLEIRINGYVESMRKFFEDKAKTT